MRFVCDSCRAQYMISDDKVGAKGVKVRCKKCGYVILVRKAEASEVTQVAMMPPGGLAPGAAAGGSLPTEPAYERPTRPHEALSDPALPPPADPSPSGGDGAVAGSAGVNGSAVTSFGGNGASGAVLGGVEDDEIGAVFDQVLKSGSHKIDSSGAGKAEAPQGPEAPALGDDEDELISTRVVSADALRKLAAEAEQMARNGTARPAAAPAPEGQPRAEEPAAGQEPEKGSGVPENDWFVAVDDQQVGPISLEKLKDMWERGEVGPDSLCWRTGFSDWTALSGVADLASVLAPKPPRPVIGALAPVMGPGSGAVMTVPVESTFNSGGMAQSIRTEMPVMAGGPASTGDTGSWQPSAASALASLVKEEMSALQKPSSHRSLLETGPSERPSGPRGAGHGGGGLLDLPPAGNELGGTNGRASPGLMELPSAGPSNAHPSSSGPPRLDPAPAAYGATAYPSYMPPPAAAPQGLSRSLTIVLTGAGVLLIGLVGVVLYLLLRPPAAPPGTVVASRGEELPMPPPPPGMERKPAEAAPAPAAPPAAAPPAVAAAPAPTPAPPTPAAPAPQAANPLPRPASRPRPVAARPGDEEEGDEITPRSARTPPSSPPAASGASTEDDFEREFGGGGGDKRKAEGDKKKTVYVPDEPGRGAQKDSLEKSDIMGVVLEHKAKIAECVNQQKAKQPGLNGQLVMRWTILPSGRTSGVSVQSDEFKSTHMATCISGLVRSMQFPRHKVQGEPIVFPFRF